MRRDMSRIAEFGTRRSLSGRLAVRLPVWSPSRPQSAPLHRSTRRLIQAVKDRDIESVRALLKQRIDVNAAQGDGATALHWAVHRDDLAMADLLIRSGARANAANDLGATPLHLACTNRSAPMVERLLAADADPRAALSGGETVLMTCARAGDAKAVRALIVRGAAVNAREHASSTDRADVGGGRTPPGRRAAADRRRRRCPRPFAHLPADRRRRADAAGGPGGAELHRVARRRHAAPVCRPRWRRRVRTHIAESGRGRERFAAGRCQCARARRAQRPWQRRGAAAGTRRRSQCHRQWIHRPARGDLEKRSEAGERAPRARRRSESSRSRRARRCGAIPPTGTFQQR